jgi:hypothetical protein
MHRFLLLVACIAFSGCVIIDSPVYRSGGDDVIFDANLLGIWELTDGDHTARLKCDRKGNTSQYRISPVDSMVSETADAYLVKVGDRTILDVVITGHPGWGHTFFLVDRNSEEKRIEMRPLAVNEIRSTNSKLHFEEIPLTTDFTTVGLPFTGPLKIGTAGIRVTSDTKALRSFLRDAPIEVWFPAPMIRKVRTK